MRWFKFLIILASYCVVWMVIFDILAYGERSVSFTVHTYLRSIDAEVHAAIMSLGQSLLDGMSSLGPVVLCGSILALISGAWQWYQWIEG